MKSCQTRMPDPVAQVVEASRSRRCRRPRPGACSGASRRPRRAAAPGPRRGHARRERVGGDPVGALGEDRHAVDHELERLAPLVRLAPKLERPQADLVGPAIHRLAAVRKHDFDSIERLARRARSATRARDDRCRAKCARSNRRPRSTSRSIDSTVRMLDANGRRQFGARRTRGPLDPTCLSRRAPCSSRASASP